MTLFFGRCRRKLTMQEKLVETTVLNHLRDVELINIHPSLTANNLPETVPCNVLKFQANRCIYPTVHISSQITPSIGDMHLDNDRQKILENVLISRVKYAWLAKIVLATYLLNTAALLTYAFSATAEATENSLAYNIWTLATRGIGTMYAFTLLLERAAVYMCTNYFADHVTELSKTEVNSYLDKQAAATFDEVRNSPTSDGVLSLIHNCPLPVGMAQNIFNAIAFRLFGLSLRNQVEQRVGTQESEMQVSLMRA